MNKNDNKNNHKIIFFNIVCDKDVVIKFAWCGFSDNLKLLKQRLKRRQEEALYN